MNAIRLHSTLLAAALLLPTGLAQAQDRDRDRLRTQDPTTHTGTEPDKARDRDQDRIRQLLNTDGALSKAQVSSLQPDIDRYVKAGGDVEQLRATVREAVRLGCKSACLGDLIRSTNRVMERTRNAGLQSHQMVNVALREEAAVKKGSDTDLGERLRQRVEQRLIERDRSGDKAVTPQRDQQRQLLRDRDQDRDMDRDMDRDRDRDQDQDRDQDRRGPGGR